MAKNKLMPAQIILMVIILVSFATIISVMGYSLLLKKYPPVVVQPTVTPTNTPEPDTSDWKTYKNEKYGFEIKYPSEKWKECTVNNELSKGDTLFLLTRTNQECYPAAESDLSDLISISSRTDIYNEYNNYEALKNALEQALNNGDKAFEVGGISYYSVEDIKENVFGGLKSLTVENADLAYGIPSTERYVFYDNKLFDISSLVTDKKFNKEIEQIVSTFRFIEKDEITDWKTYKNENFGFEIKYPSDTTIAENFNMGIIRNPFNVSFLKQNQIDIFYSLYIINKNQPREMQNFFDNPEVYNKNTEFKTITIDDMEWKSYDYTGGEGGQEPLHFILNTNNLIFELAASNDSNSNITKILSTFRLAK